MRNVWVIAEREFKHYFISPVAYVVALFIFGLLGILFYIPIYAITSQGQSQSAPGIDMVLGPLATLLIFSVPGITMRAVSEEQRNGTLELLLTAPIRDWEVILGKWLGSMMFIFMLLAVTWFYPIVLNQIVKPGIDQGLLVSSYLGLLLYASAMVAIGVMTSSFFSNQIASFIVTFGILLLLTLMSYIAQLNPTGGDLLRFLDIQGHFSSTFLVGVIDVKDVVYYVSVTALALFIGSVTVESRRWR